MKTKILLGLVALTFSTITYAGEKAGNGGIGYVCRNTRGDIDTAELLDLVEARNTIQRYQMIALSPKQLTKAQKEDKNIAEIAFEMAIDVIRRRTEGKKTADLIIDRMKLLKNNSIIQDENISVPNPEDFNPKIPETKYCHFEAIGNYLNQTLRINQAIYKELDFTSQVAFWIHEAYNYQWKQIRQNKTSDKARELVAFTVADRFDRVRFSNLIDRDGGFGLEVVCVGSKDSSPAQELAVFNSYEERKNARLNNSTTLGKETIEFTLVDREYPGGWAINYIDEPYIKFKYFNQNGETSFSSILQIDNKLGVTIEYAQERIEYKVNCSYR